MTRQVGKRAHARRAVPAVYELAAYSIFGFGAGELSAYQVRGLYQRAASKDQQVGGRVSLLAPFLRARDRAAWAALRLRAAVADFFFANSGSGRRWSSGDRGDRR